MVCIIGAEVGGSCLAQGLRKDRVDGEVFDRINRRRIGSTANVARLALDVVSATCKRFAERTTYH